MRPLGLGLVVISALLAWPGPGATQETIPAFMLKESPQPAIISLQLQTAVARGKTALAGLHAQVPDDAVPLDESVVRAARDTYVLIRAARAGMRNQKGLRKFEDPLLDHSINRIERAWNLARNPVDLAVSSLSRQEYLARSINDLSQALAIVEEVLILMP
jgi:hypothetical protein